MAGYGPVPAAIARDIIAQVGTGPETEWRYSVTDPDGQLLHIGRPTHIPGHAHTCPANDARGGNNRRRRR